MPLTRIEIEEIGPGRWVAEVEGGGTSAVRRSVRAVSFDAIILAVVDTHAALTAPPAQKAAPAAAAEPLRGQTASERVAMENTALVAEVAALPALDALRDRAAALGVDVDGRWREPRLREEMERAVAGRGGGVPAVG